MQPEEKEMLKKTLELAQENNKLLHGIRRGMFWGRITRIVYWVIIIGAAVGVYYYITPYLDNAINAYGNMKGDIKNFGDLFKISK
jgi:uncharacterized membrane protein